ncbi:cytochrome c biogenesis protein CcsA [Thermogemmatispora sp.]|uniref:cytochrome c biogenesis protein CcsA n=1 Tax=Thermogemmatispora sp. TaxID=1968838 RepID=UPI001D77584C|nr:cytochrome c biogenesis protein CcsA [Thermogemmatispora sp.]MBX5449394.1 cytochrome c biogenesis protein CcsA [Thermogemmatispora sp.]
MAVINKTGSAHHELAAPTRRPPLPLVSLLLNALACVGMMLSIWAIFLYAPTDAIEGLSQRIFYFHVPVAWLAMLSFVIVALGGAVYLWREDERWDWLALAAAEAGAVFTTLTLVTGSLWGRATWGTWWTWDARLTTSLILWFLYIAYLMLRSYLGKTPTSARAGAVLAILGVIDVPIIYESVNWWRTLHPAAEIGTPGALPPSVVLVLMLALVSFTLFYGALLIQLYQMVRLQYLAWRLRTRLQVVD